MSEDQGSERDAPRPSSSRRSAVLFVKQRAGLLCPEGKPSKNKRSGFAIAPILYILGLVGVGAGVLFSGYSQILRSNITISNNVAAKNELSGAATTLAATAELSTDASLFCPPRSSHQSTGEPCVNAPEKLVQFADVDAGDASKLPTDYDAADDDGSPEEVGVFAAGSGLKQLDPWGHFYIYCRWENARADGSDPAILLISAGANNKLESNCASTVAQNDDQMIRLNVGEAIQRAALWQATGTADVRYGATGSQVLVTASGDVTALTMTASMLSITGTAAINALTATTATLTALNLSTPLPVTSGGTGANNAYDALTNFGVSVMGRYLFNSTVLDSATAEAVRQTLLNSGTIGDALFVETTASGGRATLGATVMGDYLFSSSVLDTATAASVRQILLNSGTVGDALFVETTASGARTTLGAGEIGDALFVEETATSARSTLGGGAIGSPLFTAANTASAWNILGLTGTLSPTLDIHISGNAANVTGTVAIANGGTGETSASAALDSLFSLDTAPSQTISDSRLSNTGVTPGSYNLVTVDAKGRVTSGSLVSNEQDHITNGVGSSIYTSATDGGYLIFSTASQVQMVLDPNGYLGIGTATPMERLHVNDGNVRISNESSEAGELQFTTDANSRRWIIATGSGTQDFFIDRYDDGGTQIGSALTILRSSGNATFSGSVAATGGFLGTLTGTLYGNVEGDITGSIGLEDGTEAAPALYFTDDTNVGIYRPGDDTMGLVTGGSNVLYLTATQSVGLGTTTPSQKLDVNGAINVSDAYYLSATKILHLPADDATSLAVGAGAGDGQTGATLYNTGLGADALFTNATGAGNVALGYQAGYLVNGGGNNVIIGRSVGSTTLTTGSGNVLIGTSASVTTPAAGTSNWLNIGNTLYGDLANRRIILTGATATAGTTPSEGTIIDLSAASGTAYSSLLLPRDTMDNRPTVGITGMIRYNTTTNTVEAYQGATAAWQTLLTSTGTAGASAYLGPSAVITNPSRGDDITTGLFSGTAGTVSISISGTERLRVTATGSVGIGTETPSQLLEVNGSINVTATSGAYNIANLKMLHMPGSDDTSIAVGPWALGSQTGTGLYNTAMGVWALSSNSSANNNAAFGAGALSNTTTGNNNTALGAWTLGSNITGINNTAVGAAALNQTTTGSNNSAFGIGALYNALSHNNSAFGFNALSETTTGGYNTAFGAAAGNKITSGFANLVLGPYVASTTLTTGSNNILIGYSDAVDTPAADTSSWLNIGNTIYADLLYKRMILTGQTATAGTTPTTGTIIDLGRASGADYSSVLLPKDTSANRPVTGVQGMIRYNTDTNALEAYVGATGTWSSLLSSTSSITGNTYLGASAAANNPSRSDDVTTGLFSGTASTVSIAISGTERLRATSTGISVTGDAYVSGSLSVHGLALLTGSGTQNYLVKWTTTDTLGTGMVYDTGTSIGVGTATPSHVLDVNGNINVKTIANNYKIAGTTILTQPFNDNTSLAIGYEALTTQTGTGTANTAVGYQALQTNNASGDTAGSHNNAFGRQALSQNTARGSGAGTGNNVFGSWALYANTASGFFAGGYNNAIGGSALYQNTGSGEHAGSYNNAIGGSALYQNTGIGTNAGTFNNAFGYKALYKNTGIGTGAGTGNNVFGSWALYNNAGSGNTAIGSYALGSQTNTYTGSYNVALGYGVGSTTLVSGSSNILIGTSSAVTTPAADTSNYLNIGRAIKLDMTNVTATSAIISMPYVSAAFDNTSIGVGLSAMSSVSKSGTLGNTAVGYQALQTNTVTGASAGSLNNAFGSGALFTNTASGTLAGSDNNAFGVAALFTNTASGTYAGRGNNAFGSGALFTNTGSGNNAGSHNNAFGYNALHINAGSGNTAIGSLALGNTASTISGSYNVALGYGVGSTTLVSGSSNILIGTSTLVDVPEASRSNWLNIGNTIYGDLANKRVILTGATATSGTAATAGTVLDMLGATGTAYSSVLLPQDTSANRPTGVAGMLRYNTTTNAMEAYQGSSPAWVSLGSSTSTAGSTIYLGPSAGASSPSRSDDVTTGLFSGTAATVSTTISGTERLRVTATGVNLSNIANNYAIANVAVLQQPGSDVTSIAVGAYALSSQTAANQYNVAVGYQALMNSATASNTAVGYQALKANTTGGTNTAVGHGVMSNTTTGLSNVGVGYQALRDLTSGGDNTALGLQALRATTTGNQNTAVGNYSAKAITTGKYNTAVGFEAMSANTTGEWNVSVGQFSMLYNVTGTANTAVGGHALRHSSGSNNVALGYAALYNETATNAGNNNVAIGYYVASTVLSTGTGNILIGNSAAVDVTASGTSNWLNIGNTVYGDLANRRMMLTASGTAAVTAPVAGTILDLGGATGTAYSSVLLPKDTSANRPTTGVEGMLRYNTTTYSVEAYQGSSPAWTSLSGGSSTHYFGTSAGAASPSREDDATTGLFSGTASTVSVSTAGSERLRVTATGSVGIGTTTPSWPLHVYSSTDHAIIEAQVATVTNKQAELLLQNDTAAWFLATLGSTYGGTAFAGLTGNNQAIMEAQSASSMVFSTFSSSTAPFVFAPGRSEVMRITSAGVIGMKTASPTSGTILDMGGATGTAYSSVLLPKDTSANRPTSPVVGMLRYNTTTYAVEAYQGSSPAWVSLGSSTSTAGSTIYLGPSTASASPSRSDDATTGLFSGDAATVSAVISGTERLRVGATGLNLSDIANSYSIANAAVLRQPASDTTSIAVGPSALAAQTATNRQNVAVGSQALAANTSGTSNTAVGYQALYSNVSNSYNTAIGFFAVRSSTGGQWNTGLGYGAIGTNATGSGNVGVGGNAMYYNKGDGNTAIGQATIQYSATAHYNTALGYTAMFGVSSGTELTGSYNTALGASALYSIQTTASANTAVGGQAMYSNTTGYFNTAMGYEPLRANTTGYMNIGIGYRALYNANSHNNLALGNTALYSNTSGYDNVGLGHGSMYHMATGRKNVSVGNYAFYYNTAGWFNTAVGNEAMLGQSGFTGHGNTALGNFSLYYLDSTAGYNTGLGYYAGMSITTGSSNVVIGPGVASAVLTTGASNILIGTSASVTTTAADTSNWLNIGNTVYGDLTNRRLLLTASATAAVTAPVAGTILDMGGATGTAYSSVLLPKDTSANRPTSPVVGMLRYNTTTAKVEAYQGSSWDTLSGTSTSSSSLGTSAGATSPARSDDATTGLFSGTSATVSTSISGTERLRVTANGIDLAASGYLNYYAIGGLGVLEFPYGDTSSIAVGYEALTAQNSGNRYNTAVGRSALATATGANYNTALGNNALNDLGNGTMNTAVGAGALQLTTTGKYNTAVGAFSSYYVTGTGNTGLGNYAMVYAGSGNNNTAVGNYAMASNSSYQLTGNYNTAVGDKALYSIRTTASGNTAIGGQALYSTTTAGWNSALGYQALYSNTTGVYNIAVGYQALYSTSTGLQNTVVGTAAAYSNTGGSNNQALGGWALYYNTTGHNNTAIGDYAINGAGVSLTGSYNAALGTHALYRAQGAASNNVGIGYQAGSQVTTGGNNTILGQSVASTTLATGSYNILIGYSSAVDTPAAATTYWLNIGNTIYGDLSNRRVLLTGATATSGTAATAGTILDMSAAGGTSYSSILLPKDTSANRPGSPVTGMLRYNTTTYTVEAYQGSSPAWTSLSGGSSTHYFGTSASSTVPSRSDDATTGLFSGTAATVSVSISGTERLRVSATGANLPQTANGYAIANTSVLEFPNSDTYSIAVGSGALNAQSVSTAYNTGLGYQALPANTTGLYNTAVGGLALTSNVSGGWNVAVGVNALYSTTASFNTGLGVDSLRYNTTGNYNTAIGMQTMYGNGVALTGTGNTAMGAQALYNVRGATSGNTAVGASAMYATTTGVQNTVVGYQAMVATTTGMQNTAVGYRAMAATTNGSWNAAFGQGALQANTTGTNNTALGVVALNMATTASNNTAVGIYALNQLTTGYSNIAMGTWAGGYISTGNENTAIGMYAMYGNTSYKVTGSLNTAVGYASLYSIRTTAQLNAAVGAYALYNTTTGSFNVAVGYQALYSTTTGVQSTAVGHQALYSNTVTGNTAVGFNTLYSNTTGSSNTGVGEYALRANTTGYTNTAVGTNALAKNTTGYYNTGIGTGSLQENLTGVQNTAVGTNSLTFNTGNYNAAFGSTALYTNTSGQNNVAIGPGTLFDNTTGSYNTAVGSNALENNTTGQYNTAVGYQALYTTATSNNTAVGYQALNKNTTGGNNTAVGYQALYASTTGGQNTAVGWLALLNTSTGGDNTGIGQSALRYNINGNANTAVGAYAMMQMATGNYNTAIGSEALNANTNGQWNTSVGMYSLIFNVTGTGNTAVGGNALRGQLGHNNVGIGYRALNSTDSSTGNYNIGIGYGPGSTTNTSGSYNILIGNQVDTPAASTSYYLNIGNAIKVDMTNVSSTIPVLYLPTTDNTSIGVGLGAIKSTGASMHNTAIGYQALYSSTTAGSTGEAGWNTAVGYQALYSFNPNSGGYGANVGVGYGAADSLIHGHQNIAIGLLAFNSATNASNSVAIGSYALATAKSSGNVAIGQNAAANLSTGEGNVAMGYWAMMGDGGYPLTGANNVGIGIYSLRNIRSTAYSNVALGSYTQYSNTTGWYNTALGYYSLYTNSTGESNVAVGAGALQYTTGNYNTGVGTQALQNVSSGDSNIGVGLNVMQNVTTGSSNIGIGRSAGGYTSTGSNNIAIGREAMWGNTSYRLTGNYNIAMGYQTLYNIQTTAANNIVIGSSAGATLTTGSNNVLIGVGVDVPSSTTSNYLNILNYIKATSASAIYFPSYGNGTMSISSGLITVSSDERLKDIMGPFNRKVLGLNPILFKWKPSYIKDSKVIAGFSAQDVQKTIPEAVDKGSDGMLTLDDRAILAATINTVKDQQAMIEKQQKRIEALEKTVAEHKAVSERAEIGRGTKVTAKAIKASWETPLSSHDAAVLSPADEDKNTNTMLVMAAVGGGVGVLLLGGLGACGYMLVRTRRELKRVKKRRRRS